MSILLNKSCLNLPLAMLVSLCLQLPAWAGEEVAAATTTEEQGTQGVHSLPTLEVIGEPLPETGEGRTLDATLLRALPVRGASPNEALRILPGVQLGEEAFSGDTGGELTPPDLVIAGDKTFQNNFTIDGFNNNSFLDPDVRSTFTTGLLPDHPQGVFLHTALIESLTLLDSNIPASYGEFKGGVVAAETRTPQARFFGETRLRGTRDEWSDFRYGSDGSADFQSSASANVQPNFRRTDSGLLLNLPFGDGHAAILSYQRQDSEIPLRYLGGSRTQERRLENLFLKTRHELSRTLILELLYVTSPHVGEYFYANSLHSDYRVESREDLAGLTLTGQLPAGRVTARLGYNQSETQRDAPPNFFSWAVTPSRPWGELAGTRFSLEGMLGDLEREHRGLQFRLDWESTPWATGPVTQRLDAGVNLERQRAEFVREEDTLQYVQPVVASAVCAPDDIACAPDQYFRTRWRYPADRASTSLDRAEVYLQDTLVAGRLTLRPGARLSHDDLTGNTNLAPRLAVWYDLLGDGSTILGAGLNRYYGRALVAYKLREVAKPFTIEARTYDSATGTFSDWTAQAPRGSSHRYTDLKTPYSDEVTASLDQALFGGRFLARYIQREGRDEYAQELTAVEPDGWRYYQLNNNGRSHHEEVQLSWLRSWRRHTLELNATWQQTETSNNSYTDSFDDTAATQLVWYKGETITRSELPRLDYNRPWTAHLVYTGHFPGGFFFSNLTTWRDGYLGRTTVTPRPPEAPPEVVAVYAEKEMPSSWITDWKLGWRTGWGRQQALQISVELYNVFNERAAVADRDDEFEMGRQVWLGLEYFF